MPASRSTVAADDDSLLLPRGLIFLASLWLIAAWITAIGLRPPVQPSAATYTPAVRLMLFLVALGLLVVWPLMRLSGPPTKWAVRRTLLDLVVLLALMQVVVWPLRLVTPWSAGRTFLIDATLVSWTMLVGAIVATALPRAGASRVVATMLCAALGFMGSLTAWIGPPLFPWTAADLADGTVDRLGALTSLHRLTGGGPGPVDDAEWPALIVLAAAVVAAWIVVGVLTIVGTRGGRGQAQPIS
ncbi:MAG: hypothetical protein KDA22_05400 [Phycisphaerales bacterium]|nr:hypothetical protein [Phycisphaerales bacterium]